MILLLLKNNWKTLLLILVSVGLTIYLMNGCNKPKPAPLDTHAADSVTRVKDVIIKQKDSAIFEANARSDYWYQKYDSTSRAVEGQVEREERRHDGWRDQNSRDKSGEGGCRGQSRREREQAHSRQTLDGANH